MIHEGSQSELTGLRAWFRFLRGCNLPGETTSLRFGVTAPIFVEQGVPCKHVWAATLAADQHQYLTAGRLGRQVDPGLGCSWRRWS